MIEIYGFDLWTITLLPYKLHHQEPDRVCNHHVKGFSQPNPCCLVPVLSERERQTLRHDSKLLTNLAQIPKFCRKPARIFNQRVVPIRKLVLQSLRKRFNVVVVVGFYFSPRWSDVERESNSAFFSYKSWLKIFVTTLRLISQRSYAFFAVSFMVSDDRLYWTKKKILFLFLRSLFFFSISTEKRPKKQFKYKFYWPKA